MLPMISYVVMCVTQGEAGYKVLQLSQGKV